MQGGLRRHAELQGQGGLPCPPPCSRCSKPTRSARTGCPPFHLQNTNIIQYVSFVNGTLLVEVGVYTSIGALARECVSRRH